MLGAACLVLLLAVASASEGAVSSHASVPGDTDGDNKVSDDELKAAEESYKKGEISTEELDKIRHIKENYPRIIIDATGTEVTIYKPPERVFQISTGLIATTMYAFGDAEKIVGKGGCTKSGTTTRSFTYNGKSYSHNTPWCIEGILYPKMLDDEAIPFSGSIGKENYETIASTNPDIIIVSTRQWGRDSGETYLKSIETMRTLGVPVVVLNQVAKYDGDETEAVYTEVELLGKIFEKEDKAEEIINLLKEQVDFIKSRTADIPEDEKKSFLYLELSSYSAGKGGVAYVDGENILEPILIENIVNAKNEFKGEGRQLMSAEQLLTLDPDVIYLPTAQGVHTPDELYNNESFKDLQDLRPSRKGRSQDFHSSAAGPRGWISPSA
jgi:iron complex transport system substrate-binding protein